MSIEVQDIRKSFGDREVLKGISFYFQDRTVNMIIGSSGSGKTVLVKCIVGLLKPDSGRVLFDGQSLHEMKGQQVRKLRQNIGMLFQSSALFDSKTVNENIAFPMFMFGNMNLTEIQKRTEFCLERVNLPNAGDLLPAALSGGMKKRVGLARAIALNPKYLICDEPNSGLDPETAAVIDALIKELTLEFNMTTLVISHDMKSVMDIGDHILYIYEGEKGWEGKGKEILKADNPILQRFIHTTGLAGV